MAAGNTYVALATNTLSSTAASVTFSSISGAYTDLVVVIHTKGTSAANPGLRFNGDTGSNYSSAVANGGGGTTTSFRYASTSILKSHNAGSAMNGVWTTFTANIQNYSNATTYKTVLTRYSPTAEVDFGVGIWVSTAAITSLTVITDSSTYDTGSTFTLYGIAAA